MAVLLGLISIFSVIDLNSLVDKITSTISPPLHSLSFSVSVCNNKIKPFGLTFHLCGAIEEERYCNELKYLPLFLMNANNFNILKTYEWVGLQYISYVLEFCTMEKGADRTQGNQKNTTKKVVIFSKFNLLSLDLTNWFLSNIFFQICFTPSLEFISCST